VPALDDVWHRLHPGMTQPPTAGVFDRDQWPEPFTYDFICASADLRPRLLPSRSMAARRRPITSR
jgi:hypothetical protein